VIQQIQLFPSKVQLLYCVILIFVGGVVDAELAHGENVE